MISLNGQDITYKDLVIEINGEKYIRYVNQISIIYNYDGSYLQQPEPGRASIIASNGFYDNHIVWWGFMALQRTGDLLPFEFEPMKR
jgi:hypothetical protein